MIDLFHAIKSDIIPAPPRILALDPPRCREISAAGGGPNASWDMARLELGEDGEQLGGT